MSNIVLWQPPSPSPKRPRTAAQQAATERMRRARAAKAAGKARSRAIVVHGAEYELPHAAPKRRRKKRAASAPHAPTQHAAAPKKRRKKRASAHAETPKRKKARPAAKKAHRSTSARRKPRGAGFFAGAARVKRPGHRPVTIVAPHPSGKQFCHSCNTYHDLRQHWSHRNKPHAKLTRTEHSYLCRRYGICPAKPKKVKKKSAPKRKKKVDKPMTLKECRALLCRQKYAKKAKRR